MHFKIASSSYPLKLPMNKFIKTKAYERKRLTKNSIVSKSHSNIKVKKIKKKTFGIPHNASENKNGFFNSKTAMNINENRSIPEAINKIYLINVEAARNQVNLQKQLKTNNILNKNFGIKFIRNKYGSKELEGVKIKTNLCIGRSVDNLNPALSYQNYSYKIKREVYQTPFQKQQKIIGRYSITNSNR